MQRTLVRKWNLAVPNQQGAQPVVGMRPIPDGAFCPSPSIPSHTPSHRGGVSIREARPLGGDDAAVDDEGELREGRCKAVRRHRPLQQLEP